MSETAAMNNVDGVIHSVAAPSSGSQRCDICGGWIVCGLAYLHEGIRYCPACWRAKEACVRWEAIDD